MSDEKSPAWNGAQAVGLGTAQVELTSTASAVNGKHTAPVHWQPRSGRRSVACGIDINYHREVVVSRTVAEITCKQCVRCLRAHKALTTMRGKARRWDRLSGHEPKRTYVPRPLVNVGVAFDHTFARA